ncbi:MAG: nucleotidyltransferase [Bacteroidota bacterium]
MARTIAEIQQSIINAKTAESALAALTSTSNTAVWRLWTYIVAVCIWTVENLFDFHKAEVASIITTQKPHTLQWYVKMAKAFQYGYSLPPDHDTYATISDDPLVVVVKYAAAVELLNLVRIKAARQGSAGLEGLSAGQLISFAAYMNRIKDAGVRLQLTSGEADNLRLQLNIFYDPLILSNTGERLDGTSLTPVMDAINAFLSNLPFNGLFVLNHLIAALQAIDGVLIGEVASAAANYASTPYVPVTVEYTPDAGYMTLDEAYFDANVTYNAHGPI